MPSVQRGQVYKLAGGSWAYRYRDENGRRRQVGAFATKGEASASLSLALDRARLGPLVAARRDWTLRELVDRYLAQHQAAPATIARLRAMLGKATALSETFQSVTSSPTTSGRGRRGSPRDTATTP